MIDLRPKWILNSRQNCPVWFSDLEFIAGGKLRWRTDVRFGSQVHIWQCNRHVRFPPKADTCGANMDVRFVPIADMCKISFNKKRPPTEAAFSCRQS